MPEPIEIFKSQFHSHSAGRGQRLIHLNNAGQSPICRPAYEALNHWARVYFEKGAHGFPELFEATIKARQEIARFLGAKTHELAFFQSAAGAISQVALGLDLKPGDEIVLWEQEYPSNFYPWNEAAKRSGAKLVIIPNTVSMATPIDELERHLSARTRVIASSWVQFRSGAILELEALGRLGRERGIFTCVDVIQGAGVLPFDFASLGIDAACGGSHKWMASAHGTGFLCLREEHVERLCPVMVGAFTYGGSEVPPQIDAVPRAGAERFEPGGKAFAEIIALASAARLMRETGIDRIAQEADWLARKLTHGLRERGYVVHSPHGSHHRGAIVNFSSGPDAPLKTNEEIQQRLQAHGISNALRPPGIRLSPHAHNTPEDIEAALEALTV